MVDAGATRRGQLGGRGRTGLCAEGERTGDTGGTGEDLAAAEVGWCHRPAPQTSYPKPRAVSA